MINKTIISLICAGAVVAPCSAQVAKEITVEREVVATLRDASPLAFTPSLNLPPVEKPSLTYSDYTITSRIPALFSLLEPTGVASSVEQSPWRGYAAIGYFPLFNLGASAGYRLIDRSATTLDAWLQYDGSSYKLDKEFAESNNIGDSRKINSQSVALGMRLGQKVGSQGLLGIDADFAYDRYSNPFIGARSNGNENQTVSRFNISALLTSKTNDLGYSLGARLNHFSPGPGYTVGGQKLSGARENDAALSAAVFADVNDNSAFRLDIDAGMYSLSRSAIPESYINWFNHLVERDGKTRGLITFTPSYRYNSGQFALNLGARVDISINDDKAFHIAPDVKATWTPSSFFALFGRAGGGEYVNTMGSLYAIDRYICPVLHYDFSHIPIEAEAGLRVGSFRGASFSLSAAYAKANSWLMPYAVQTGTTTFTSDDIKGLQIRAAAEYNYRNLASIAVKGALTPQDEDDPNKGYYLDRDRAKYELSADLTIHPVSQLDIMAGYELRASRRMSSFHLVDWALISSVYPDTQFSITFWDINQHLPNLANLRAGAAWHFTPAVTVFARLDNILNRNAPYYSLIPGQGFTGLVGLACMF